MGQVSHEPQLPRSLISGTVRWPPEDHTCPVSRGMNGALATVKIRKLLNVEQDIQSMTWKKLSAGF